MSAKKNDRELEAPAESLDQQARQQTGAQQVQLRLDEREMSTIYANAFRTNATAEEVMLDFGVNLPNPAATPDKPEIIFRITSRVVLNYYSAKRLAITLSQLIRRFEEQFGGLELNVANRRKGTPPKT
jgi:hypothetical protein